MGSPTWAGPQRHPEPTTAPPPPGGGYGTWPKVSGTSPRHFQCPRQKPRKAISGHFLPRGQAGTDPWGGVCACLPRRIPGHCEIPARPASPSHQSKMNPDEVKSLASGTPCEGTFPGFIFVLEAGDFFRLLAPNQHEALPLDSVKIWRSVLISLIPHATKKS